MVIVYPTLLYGSLVNTYVFNLFQTYIRITLLRYLNTFRTN